MATIDLDAAAAARAEARAAAGEEQHTLVFRGATFTLPAEMPLTFAEESAVGNWKAGLAAILGDQTEAFYGMKPEPTTDDMVELAKLLATIYVGPDSEGEPEASPD